jgi:crotonobetainyl-CoA:carnitine CoA-transferase CaiB-like acyl-CoA transferase
VPEVADDPRFANPILRSQNGPALVQLMREAAERTTVEQFLAGAEVHDVPASKVNSLHDLPTDGQVVHNAVFVEREHPSAGRLREPRPAPRFSHTPARVGSHAPRYGEHSDEIVTELGLDAAALRAAGIIA